MTAEAAGAVPDDVIEPVALVLLRQAGEELDDLDQDPDAELYRADAREVIAAFLSVPSVAEVFARDAKVRELREDVTFLAKCARGSSWPGPMADQVQRAADRVVHEFGTDADRTALAALYSEDGTR